MPFRDINQSQSWKKQGTPSSITIDSTSEDDRYLNSEVVTSEFLSGYPFDQNKTYQYITNIQNYGGGIKRLSMDMNNSLFKIGTIGESRILATTSNIALYNYAVPNISGKSISLIRYAANKDFNTCGILSSKMNDIDFIISGYREFSYEAIPFNDPLQPSGWLFTGNNEGAIVDTGASQSFSYEWMSNPTSSIIPNLTTFGVGNNISSVNYIAKLIEYDEFNLKLDYDTNNDNHGVDIYLAKYNRLNNKSQWVKIDSLTQSQVGYNKNALKGIVNGSRNYLIISASESNNNFVCNLKNISITGGYNPINNTQLLTSDTNVFDDTLDINVDIPFSSYQFDVISNNSSVTVNSKIGNGSFQSGIWENGIWNNGWRDDQSANDFNDIEFSILTNSDISWRIKIVGPASSVVTGSQSDTFLFDKGDKVTIGNIVAVDINDNRKLLKGYYTIEDAGKESFNGVDRGYIIVNLDTTFPYRRIERDSANHKIKVTKNIWLSGAFLNGYFSGVWNNGLFKGYPYITEMYDTQWVDGFFNGGHFESHYPEFEFIGVYPRDFCSAGYTNIRMRDNHDIKIGDYVFIKFNDVEYFVASGGVQNYDGLVRVLSIGEDSKGKFITINRLFSGNIGIVDNEGMGIIQRYTSTSVIQNFKFYDNNRSNTKSSESNISSSVFSYDSWIDVNYDNSRSVTLGRDFRAYEPLTGKSINRNNLFGYPTYDVLSSSSRFRDSNSLDVKLYKLGTKYKVFTDFIGEYSEFNEPFNPDIDFSNFFLGGWTYSVASASNIKFNRTESIISANDSNAQEYIDSGVTGDELFVIANSSGAVINNNNVDVQKGRYSIAEFNVITHSVASYEYTFENLDIFSTNNITIDSPFIASTGTLDTGSIAKGILAVDSDLIVDSNYDFGTGFNILPSERVSSIAKLSDGTIITSGSFTTFKDIALNSANICKINTDSSINNTFDSNFGNIIATMLANKILVDSSDNIYLILSNKIIKLSSDGTVINPTLITVTGSKQITNAIIHNGGIVVIGNFTTITNSSSTYTSNKLVKIDFDGNYINTLLSYFSSSSGSNEIPYAIEVDNSNDDIYIGGNFTTYGLPASSVGNFIKIDSTGNLKSTTPLKFNTVGTPSPTNVSVNDILLDDDDLYIAGTFTTCIINAITKSKSRIIKINLDIVNSDIFTEDLTFIAEPNRHIKSLTKIGSDNMLITMLGTTGATYNGVVIKSGCFIINKNNGSIKSNFIAPINAPFNSSPVYDVLVDGNTIILVGEIIGYNGTLKEITSSYNITNPLESGGEIKDIEVKLDLSNTDLSKILINLKSPSGDIINLKSSIDGAGETLYNTTFSSIDSYIPLYIGTSPYTGKFRMNKSIGLGNSIKSNTSEISDLDILGNWTLYIMDTNINSNTILNNWSIRFGYDLNTNNNSISEPLAKFPIINFSNLNYEISTQISTDNTNVQVYKKMNYLPVSNNINHLLTTNTFRLDSVERATPEQWGGFGDNLENKKFEYFYNKTDLMMSINGNGKFGASQSTIVLDNIKYYEVDMIPFFKYFNDSNIYKGIQIPFNGVAPEIDYLDTDFIFIDNISIGIEDIENEIKENEVICSESELDLNKYTVFLSNTVLGQPNTPIGPTLSVSGVSYGTQSLKISAILERLLPPVILNPYSITWTYIDSNLIPLTFDPSTNVGNEPSVNISVGNNKVYNLSVEIVYSGITQSTSCDIVVSDVPIIPIAPPTPPTILNINQT